MKKQENVTYNLNGTKSVGKETEIRVMIEFTNISFSVTPFKIALKRTIPRTFSEL